MEAVTGAIIGGEVDGRVCHKRLRIPIAPGAVARGDRLMCYKVRVVGLVLPSSLLGRFSSRPIV